VILSSLHWLQRNVEWSWALNVDVMILWLASVYSDQARRANSDEAIDNDDVVTQENEF